MHNHHYRRVHFISFAMSKKLSELYVFIILRTLAFSMIGTFIPIYFLNEVGYTFKEVLIFYIILFLFFGFFSFLAAKLSSKIGFKHIMFISLFPQLIFYYLLNHLEIIKTPLIILALLAGAADGLFWISFHTNFVLTTDKKHRGEEIGLWHIIATIIGVAGPFLGGLILTLYNFYLLFIIVSVLLIISMIPLLYSEDIYKKSPIDWKSIWKYSTGKEAIIFLVRGIRHMGLGIFWPIFIFFVVAGYFSMGLVISLSSLVMIIFTWLIARASDKYNKLFLIRIGALFDGIIWIAKIFVRNFFQILGVGLLGGIAYTLVDIPFTANMYNKARRTKRMIEYFMFREFFLIVGRLICLFIILGTASKFEFMANLKISFVLSSIASFIQMLI